MNWYIYYRGPLGSCNYGCSYCPFSKRTNTLSELKDDFDKLDRFTEWVSVQKYGIRVLFTPWGEALIHPAYQKALIELSHLPHLQEVAIQTNLSGKLDWIANVNPHKMSLWATYHPSETDRSEFLERCFWLRSQGIAFSVGVVGKREHFDEIEALRRMLPDTYYLWVNAFDDDPSYYTGEEIKRLERYDPLFPVNVKRYPSLGRACYAGETAFTVDGNGDVRRCHFIHKVIGNIYEDDFSSALKPKVCTNETCSCHIGYVHLKELQLYERFGNRLAGRIPLGYT
ncbi:STM4011 family radical SAM protein [Rubellicoccus peritrichatus]|uniref:STM4011 family radical SAM protein n=1 Tax=Rubellicoccus peritrichatus TaxID=3080537 RepID=A0AAQ3L7M3_9BACT|nr:STM4011 family radical SAM protein [Puniceicoccus sp. CR14]WOO39354.1 STM4011 family radical SAM protein [Puniceicoccus sp. CR14]